MTDSRPVNPADRELADQVGLLADAAFAESNPVALPPVLEAPVATAPVALTTRDHRNDRVAPPNSSHNRRNVFAAAATVAVVLLCGVALLGLRTQGAVELHVAGQPDPAPTALQQPDDSVPEVVLPPAAAMPSEMPVAFDELAISSDEIMVLSRGQAFFAPKSVNQMMVSRTRGLDWFTFHGPLSTARQGCLNADDAQVVGASMRQDGLQWLTTHRLEGAGMPPGGGTDSVLLEAMFASDRDNPAVAPQPRYCRPAKVGDRWATAASDGRLLTVFSQTGESGSQLVSVLTLPAELQGQPSQTDLYADGDRFVAEICMVVESLCSTTHVSFPAAALENQGELFVHTPAEDENRTLVAERYGIALRDLLEANQLSPSNELKIPGIGAIDPSSVQIDGPSLQGHPSLFDGGGSTWQVHAVDVDDDPEITYSGAGIYAVGRFGDEPVPLPANDVWRVDVFPEGDSARVRAWLTQPNESPAEHRWYAWSGADRAWVSIDDPVIDWPTIEDWNQPVTFVEVTPSGRIRVIADAGSELLDS